MKKLMILLIAFCFTFALAQGGTGVESYFTSISALAGLVLVIVAAIKNQTPLKGRVLFFLSLGVGIVLSVSAYYMGIMKVSLLPSAIFGLLAGFFAAGSYDAASPLGRLIIVFSEYIMGKRTVMLDRLVNPVIPTSLVDAGVRSFVPPNLPTIPQLLPETVINLFKMLFPVPSEIITSSYNSVLRLLAMVKPVNQMKAVEIIAPTVVEMNAIIRNSQGTLQPSDHEKLKVLVARVHKLLSEQGLLTVGEAS